MQRGTMKRLATLLLCIVPLLLVTPAGASKVSKAATIYSHYYNVYMVNAFNKGVRLQNSSNPSTSTTGIDQEVVAINNFDNMIQTIKFPSSDKTALHKVLNADSYLVSLDRALAINTSNSSFYNSLLSGVISAEARRTVAINALAKNLGMDW
jgi:hypothetical protein